MRSAESAHGHHCSAGSPSARPDRRQVGRRPDTEAIVEATEKYRRTDQNYTDFSVSAPRPPLVRARPRASVKVFDVKEVFDTPSCRGSPKSRRHGSKIGFSAPKHALHDLRLTQLLAKNLLNNKYFHGILSWRPHESWL